MINVLLEPMEQAKSDSRNWVALILIGEDYRLDWEVNAKDSVMKYAMRFGLGVVVITDFIDRGDEKKEAPWQKLLIGELFQEIDPSATGVLVMDTDVIANFLTGENPFDVWDSERIGMISLRKRMPYDYTDTAKKIAFSRHHFVSASYPLDSTLLFSVNQVYDQENLPSVEDECCTGVFLFDPQAHSIFLADIYRRYIGIGETAAYEQTHVNYCVQKAGLFQPLGYQFQMIWAYEMAQKYPFLYLEKYRDDLSLAEECVLASILSGTFLHFAGRWIESNFLLAGKSIYRRMQNELLKEYAEYDRSTIHGRSRGMINPPSK